MQDIGYSQFIGAYIGVSLFMIELIVITLTTFVLAFLQIHKDKINKNLFYAFRIILWVVLFFTLVYVVSGVYSGILYKWGICFRR